MNLNNVRGLVKLRLSVVPFLVCCLFQEVSIADENKLFSNKYYVCDNGSDTNNGNTPSSPWKTFQKAINEFNQLEAGEGIYFCRGGEFFVENKMRIFNKKCTADRKCIIADYLPINTLSKKRPVIVSKNGESIFNLEDGGAADHDEGYILRNIVLKGHNGKGAGVFLFNDIDDLIIDNLKIDGFGIGIHSSGVNTTTSLNADRVNERVVLINSEIVNNSAQGWLGSCNDCTIKNNTFDNNGYARAIYNHNIYFAGEKARNIIIANNLLKNSAIVNGKCQGVSLVVHGEVKNLRIENNRIEEHIGKAKPECWGISVDPGYDKEEKFENIVITGNTLINTGNVSIGCASCVNVTVNSNVIINKQNFRMSGIKIPVRNEDSVKTSGVTINDNVIELYSETRKIKTGIEIGNNIDIALKDNKVYSNYADFHCMTINGKNINNIGYCKPLFSLDLGTSKE